MDIETTIKKLEGATVPVPAQLASFVEACRAKAPSLELFQSQGNLFVRLGRSTRCLTGYSFPYQAYLITNLMDVCGAFR